MKDTPLSINCPVCFTPLAIVHDHPETRLSACLDCGTSVSVPSRAWEKRLPKVTHASPRSAVINIAKRQS